MVRKFPEREVALADDVLVASRKLEQYVSAMVLAARSGRVATVKDVAKETHTLLGSMIRDVEEIIKP